MVSPRPRPQSTGGVLLVEGRSDEQVVLHICNRHSSFSVEGELGSERVELNSPLNPSFSVSAKGSDSELLKDLRNQLSPPSPQVVGIIMDADDNIANRWEGIMRELARANIALPSNPAPDGRIVDTQDLPRVGVWIMPDNESSGELEHFVQQMLPADDPIWPLSQEYINEIPEEYRLRHLLNERKRLKAQFYAWLATRSLPGLMGKTIGDGDLDIDGELCQRFIAWLENLFS